MSVLEVACAIIEHEGLTLVVQRSAGMKQGLLWEFPGGKLEPGEKAEDCIVREIKEELGITIQPERKLSRSVHGNICLIPFICSRVAGDLYLHEHKEALWLRPHELHHLNWCPADIPVVKEYTGNLK